MLISGIIAIIIAYLLGSFSGAYIVTRVATGKDIRTLGGGNAGARNVYRSVGFAAAAVVAVIDVGKGAAALAIAELALRVSPLFMSLAVLAVVAGHIWPCFFKFRGGNGLATCIGVLLLALTRELFVVLGIMLVILVLTRNPVFGLNAGLVSLPVSSWFFEKSWLAVIFSCVLLAIMVLHFLPTVKAAIGEAGGIKDLSVLVVQGGEPETRKKKKRKKKA